ncbi:MAG: apolipoprotein N-acyltransferase [Rhodobacteraceae bacterium]|nr:apolipoprotein N-acyltransferase [Paracoccaceae bacterium]
MRHGAWDRALRWSARYPKWAAALLGGGVALGHAPLSLWLISIGCLILFFSLSRHAVSPMKLGWMFGFGYFLVTLNWIVEPFLIDLQTTGFMAPFALLFMAGGLALFWGAAGWFVRPFDSFGWVLGLTVAEYFRGVLFTGFPWGLLSYTLSQSPVVGYFAWVGPHGVTLFLLMICALFAQRLLAAVAGVSAIMLTCALIPLPEVQRGSAETTVRLVQPNAPQEQKWDPFYAPIFLDRMIEATAADPKVDVIIWPESAIYTALNYADRHIERLRSAAGRSDVIFGILRIDERDRLYNSLVLSRDDQTSQIYDKRHLVPFGEYLPFEDWLVRNGFGFAPELFGVGFSAGRSATPMILSNSVKILPVICYEIIFPRAVSAARQDADVIVQISNDAWFGGFSGPAQHLEITRVRAIEQGMPIIRVSNPGISAVINGRGEIADQIPLNTTSHLDVQVPLIHYKTPYAWFGNWAFWVIWIALLALAMRQSVIKD